MPAAFDGTAFQAIERPLALAVDHRLPAACCLLPAVRSAHAQGAPVASPRWRSGSSCRTP
ncbi:hypothetical protein BRN51_22290 [Xanthomonas oryzae pv. oryzae]|uniref:Uncharacterized protein n=1 Tax=Xanthomonas oryzae pv. oryzae (strain PXO99A) TaxID=360094 RepID=A0A0K0GQN9_XANOP|nr:hypothetical protein PXO_03052 [Xanthomonas oryzae pv. oryzae PXO99A]AXM41509.1 hypothetical protein BRN51_22290 [Xanthomonas oryzae pv. oryzae]RBF89319.1 hypothetical protein BRM95_07610 [Xanthomonas oryzae pv. oryzae]RBK69421.1 hypothetical protein BRN49_04160 [Xanthomonas oryzae pv. oryzae]